MAKPKTPKFFLFQSCLFLGLFLGLSTGRLSAAIGETKKQLAARYGRPKELGYQDIYDWNGYTVNVYFDKSQISKMEVFTRKPALDSNAKPSTTTEELQSQLFASQPELSDDDVNQILQMNGDKYGWGNVTTQDGERFWYRGDRKVFAQYKKESKALVLMSN